MLKNNKQMALFKDIFGKKVQIDFNGGKTTSDAGMLILAKIASNLSIFEKLSYCFIDRRHPGYILHSLINLFKQRIFQICAHYEDCNDSDFMRYDPTIKLLCNRLPESGDDLASQPTMSRLENSPSRKDLYRMGEAFIELFIDSYKKPPKSIILDFDETEDTVYGHQQLSLFNKYYKSDCYLPLHIYEGNSGKLICAILRPGRRPSGKETVMYLKRIVSRLRTVWPDVNILFRADSNYSGPDVYQYCDDHNIKFAIGLTPRAPIWRKAQETIDRANATTVGEKCVKIYGEFRHQAKTWTRPLRIIAKVEKSKDQQKVRFIVTSCTNKKAKTVCESIYEQRGKAELYIKDHKRHLASDRTSCSSFEANQFRLFMHSAAYVLLHTLREIALKKTEFANVQFNTIQIKLFKIGARVKEMKTKVKIQFSSSYPYQNTYRFIWQLANQ
jgi:hypothetical protein